MTSAKRALTKLALIGTLAAGAILTPMVASAAPTNPPENSNACVGRSSTTANAIYQDQDAAKFRDEQARGEAYLNVEAGEQGRQDDVQAIC